MIEHDLQRRRTAQADRRPRPRRQHHRPVLHRQRPALQHLAGCRHHALPQRKELQLGRCLPRALLHPLARPFPGGHDAQRHRLPRGLAAHLRRRRRCAGHQGASCSRASNSTAARYKNYIDGYNQLDYLSGKTKESPRNEFIYVNDDGQIVAMRYDEWKAVFLENRGEAFGVWREPFTELRVPLLFNLRRDPFETAQHNSNTYNDWFLDRVFVLAPMQQLAAKFLMTMKDYPPSQTAGLVQPREGPEADRGFHRRQVARRFTGAPAVAGGGRWPPIAHGGDALTTTRTRSLRGHRRSAARWRYWRGVARADAAGPALTAIDVLLEPDGAMLAQPRRTTPASGTTYPKGFALTPRTPRTLPFSSASSCTRDLDKVFAAVAGGGGRRESDRHGVEDNRLLLHPGPGETGAGRNRHRADSGLAPASSRQSSTPSRPTRAADGDRSGVRPERGRQTGRRGPRSTTSTGSFRSPSAKNYNPHVTIGVGHEEYFSTRCKAEPFTPFTFKAAAA